MDHHTHTHHLNLNIYMRIALANIIYVCVCVWDVGYYDCDMNVLSMMLMWFVLFIYSVVCCVYEYVCVGGGYAMWLLSVMRAIVSDLYCKLIFNAIWISDKRKVCW